jgi:hypothetical protein
MTGQMNRLRNGHEGRAAQDGTARERYRARARMIVPIRCRNTNSVQVRLDTGPSSNQSRGTSAYICGKTPSATGRSVDQARMGDDHEYHVASPQVEAGHDRAQGQHDTQDMPQVPSPQAERNEGSQRE